MAFKKVLLFVLFFCTLSVAQDEVPQTTEENSPVTLDSLVVYSRTFTVEMIAWPFENIVEPLVTLAISPIRAPIDYIFQERIVDKAIDAVTFGPRDNIIVNPVLKLGSGPGSLVGFSYRHFRLMGDDHNDAFRVNTEIMINYDWRARVGYSRSQLFGSDFGFKIDYGVKNIKSDMFKYPDNGELYLFADSSWSITTECSHPLLWGWSGAFKTGMLFNRFADPSRTTIQKPQGLEARGFPSSGESFEYKEVPYIFSLSHNTKETPFTATSGHLVEVAYLYSSVEKEQKFRDLAIDYHSVTLKAQKYLLLGKRYALTDEEVKENQRFLSNLNVSQFLSIFSVEKLEKNFLQRKVMVFQLVARQMWDAKGSKGSFTGYSEIGNGTPLRGYGGAEGVNKAMLAASMEYRFPLLKLVDGTFFVDYATVSSNLTHTDELKDTKNFKGSWGLGMRMRKPNLFISRLQFAMGGFHTFKINLTISPAY